MTILKKHSLALIFIAAAAAQNVVTQHYDIARSGQNIAETTLTPANVNTNSFGRLFSVPVQGYVYAQPLYMSNLTIPGRGQHNVVFIATEHDSVYAFDADTNGGVNATPLWQITLLDAAHGAAADASTEPNGNVSTQDINPEIGITGTPVIDPVSGTMYLVGQTVENGIPIQRLHALDVTSGAEKFGGPVKLAASVPGTGNGSSGGVLNFDPKWQNNRAGLLLLNGIVYLAFGSHGDNGPWHGWILAYNAKTLAQTGVFCTTANGSGSGVWMAGSGLAADVVNPANSPYGRLFVATGNGSYNATIPYTNTMSYGDDLLRLDLTNGVPKVTDAFTPYNQQQLSSSDADLASGGILILPDQATGGHTHLLVQAGKQGTLYLVDRDSMGDFGAADNVVQEITGQIKGLWSMPTYWNNNVYVWGNGDHLKAFSLSNGLLSATPTSLGSETSQFPGSTATVSANGNANGIVWNIQSDAYGSSGPAILFAHDATNVATTLYSSSQNATRDAPGNAVKFTVPLVINGKVYVGAQNQVSVYGLLNGAQQAAAPVIQPSSQTFLGSMSVTMSDATSGASIYYTTDGTLPTEASNLYTGPFSITSTTTIRALASLNGFLDSPVTSATYTSQSQATAPVFSPAAGAYTSAQSVTISDDTPGAVIYYTLDGTTPTTSSPVYSGPIQIKSSATITAMATASGQQNSPNSTANYSIQLGGTGINFGNGFSTAASSTQFNGSTGLDDSRLQLTNGGYNQAGSAFYKTAVGIQNFTNDFAFQLSNPNGHGITFTIQSVGPTALGGIATGLGYGPATTGGTGGIPNSVAIKFDLYNNAGEGSNSTGLYINGAIPTVPAVSLAAGGVNLHSGDTMQVHMTYDGTTLAMTITDPVVNKSFTTSWQVNIPSAVGGSVAYVGFTGGTGSITASQKIMTWTYVTAAPQTATPILSPIGGNYMPPQSVTITDATPGASIFYTLDGTTPSSASTPYTGPIALSAATTVVSAIAIATQPSSVASSTYKLMDFSLSASPASVSVAAGQSGITSIAIVPVNGFNGSVALSASGLPSGVSASFNPSSTTGSSTLTLTVAANTASGTSSIKITGVAGSLTRTKTVTLTIPAPQTQVTAPKFSPVSGTYTTTQAVTISDTTSNATIHFTLDGTTPTTSSAVYSGPIQVSSSLTVKAMATAAGLSNSPVSSATYSIQTTQTGINFGSGFSGAQSTMQFNGSTTLDSGSNLQLTNGGGNEAASAFYKTPIGIQSFTTDFTFQLLNPNAHGITFTIQGNGPTAIGQIATGLGYGPSIAGGTGGISKSVAVKFDLYNNAGEGSNSTGLYTNGAIPTVPAVTIGNGVSLHSGNAMSVHLTYDGTTLSMTITDTVTNNAFTTSWPVNIPAVVGGNTAFVGFTGGTGSLSATQKILTWTYVAAQQTQAAAPAFSPSAGTFASAQSVSISDSTPNATIFYTLDGTPPTTSSPVYSSPINVSFNTTIKALATAAGYSNSAISSAAYSIQTGGATLSFASGFSNAQTTLQFNGSTTLDSSSKLQLTNGGGNEAASAFYKTRVGVQSFTTDFTFQLINPNGHGITFTIQGNGPTALGGIGAGLGYGPATAGASGGIPTSIAVKFDLYSNAGEGSNSTGLYTNGAFPTVPAVTIGSGISLHSGDTMSVHMTYDGSTLAMTITDTVTKNTFTTSWPINIPAIVGGNTAYVGFTGSTGTIAATQKVITWTYSTP